ncbi:MAG: XdhC family protein [Oscillospiraceae bacterium]|nr:XdhC family protein [Oscillospiraceae bacterium]
MKQIFAQLFYELEKHNDAVLVSLIDDNGSAPRGAGSQMLITDRGRRCGTIGGGAVEKRSEELALSLIAKKQSLVHTFRLHTNQTEDIGMVCGGDVTVHFQFIAKDDPAWHKAAACVLALYEKKEAGHLVLREDGSAPTVCDAQGASLCGAAVEGKFLAKGCLRTDGLFTMPVAIGNRAILFGAGHIAQSLCPILESVDFRVTVFDSRAEFARKELFPTAEAVICGDYERVSDYLTIDENDYLVIMTSGHSFDFAVERQVLMGDFAYVGVIGSRSKTASVNARLWAAGVSEEKTSLVHTPIGTAIRAVTPQEIAVSIAGEMILERAIAREGAAKQSHSCPMK